MYTVALSLISDETNRNKTMKVAKINQIQELADGTTIGEMRVTVKKVFPPKTGEGKFGTWRVQSCILQDSTGEIRGSFWIPSGMDDLQGQMITIKSRSTPKGLQGLSVAHSNHSNSNELKINDKAAILTDAELAAEGGVVPAPQRAVTSKSPITTGALTPAEARKALFQAAQLMAEAIKAAAWVGEQVTVTPEQLQAIATSLFISADRAGFAKAFPASAAKPQEQETEPETEKKDEDDFGW